MKKHIHVDSYSRSRHGRSATGGAVSEHDKGVEVVDVSKAVKQTVMPMTVEQAKQALTNEDMLDRVLAIWREFDEVPTEKEFFDTFSDKYPLFETTPKDVTKWRKVLEVAHVVIPHIQNVIAYDIMHFEYDDVMSSVQKLIQQARKHPTWHIYKVGSETADIIVTDADILPYEEL